MTAGGLLGLHDEACIQNPHQVVDALPEADFVEQVEIAGPGFINFYLKDGALQNVIADVRAPSFR